MAALTPLQQTLASRTPNPGTGQAPALPPTAANGLWAQAPPPQTGGPSQAPGGPQQASGGPSASPTPPAPQPSGMPPSNMTPVTGGSPVVPPNPHTHQPSEPQRWMNAQRIQGAIANNWSPNPALLQAMLQRS